MLIQQNSYSKLIEVGMIQPIIEDDILRILGYNTYKSKTYLNERVCQSRQ
jgi:hypothetical protein